MIVKMKKLSLIAVASEADAVINELTWLSCAEIEKRLATEEETILREFSEPTPRRAELENARASLAAAIPLLSPYRKDKKGLFSQTRPPLRKADIGSLPAHAVHAIGAAERAMAIEEELGRVRGEMTKKTEEMRSLSPWTSLDIPLGFSGTERTTGLFGVLNGALSLDDFSALIADAASGASEVIAASDEPGLLYVLILYDRNREKEVQTVLRGQNFTKLSFPQVAGTASEQLTAAATVMTDLQKREQELSEERRGLASFCEDMEAAYDMVETQLAVLGAKEKMAATDRTVIIRGWIPAAQEKRLAAVLSGFTCSVELSDPEEGDDVPVRLHNNAFADPFESLIGLYSYPRYGSFDPTMIMGIFFALFFGLMSADVGYGFVTLVGSLLALRLMKPRLGMSRFLKMFAICGASSMVMGVLFNGWFGDLPQQFATNILGKSDFGGMWHLIDPISDPITFFIIALAMGAIHLFTGMIIKMVILIRQGEVFSAIFDIGSWFVVYAGIALYFIVGILGAYVALAGVLMVILTHGRHQKNIIMKFFSGLLGLYDIVNFMSDLLSYSRVLALGLSSAVIASVFNVLATLGGSSVISFILFPLVFVLGHLLNLALSLLSSFIHSSRLQYVEFFGKFYEDGGWEFQPVSPKLKYTDISADEVK